MQLITNSHSKRRCYDDCKAVDDLSLLHGGCASGLGPNGGHVEVRSFGISGSADGGISRGAYGERRESRRECANGIHGHDNADDYDHFENRRPDQHQLHGAGVGARWHDQPAILHRKQYGGGDRIGRDADVQVVDTLLVGVDKPSDGQHDDQLCGGWRDGGNRAAAANEQPESI